jgi:hypothetical protein
MVRKRGGSRRGAGAPLLNTNRQKKIALPTGLDLGSPVAVRRFLREILIPAAISGRLGVRTVTAVTSALKLLLDSQEAELLELLDRRLKVLEKDREVQSD